MNPAKIDCVKILCGKGGVDGGVRVDCLDCLNDCLDGLGDRLDCLTDGLMS